MQNCNHYFHKNYSNAKLLKETFKCCGNVPLFWHEGKLRFSRRTLSEETEFIQYKPKIARRDWIKDFSNVDELCEAIETFLSGSPKLRNGSQYLKKGTYSLEEKINIIKVLEQKRDAPY